MLTLGVIFEDLTVRGFGGAKYYIRTFPDAFVSFFNVWGTFKTLFAKKTGIEFDILKDFTGCVRPGEVLSRTIVTDIDASCSWSSGERMHHFSTSDGKSTSWVYKYRRQRGVRWN